MRDAPAVAGSVRMIDMVTKSMPLPALPPELPEESYNIDVPVRFTL